MTSTLQDADSAVRSTDLDASGSRLSAVNKGYLSDSFIRSFVPRPHLQPPRPPLINIGTYIRSTALDELVDGFIDVSANSGCQIISMGAGSDTRFWRLSTGPRGDKVKVYVELDFPEVTTKKAMSIKKNKNLLAVLGSPDEVSLAHGGSALHSPRYHLLPVDLRVLPESGLGPLVEPVISPSIPLLLLFECVLAYIPPTASIAIVDWFAKRYTDSVLGGVVYEMFGLEDPFGQVMVNNMKFRNILLPGVEPYSDFSSLPNRFLQHGFTTARALTLKDIRKTYTNRSEVERISRLEFLDEIEELDLVLNHYAITWGYMNSKSSGDNPWDGWGLTAKDQRNSFSEEE